MARIKKVVAAHDVGKVMNPALLEGQLEGSIHMGLGYALTEEFRVENGVPQTMTVNSQGLLRARHMPEVEIDIDRSRPSGRPIRSKGSRRDRAGADGAGRRRRAVQIRRGSSVHAADEGLSGGEASPRRPQSQLNS